ncbi:MAG: hypothetical protein LBJ01_09280 [Tannerella sp.]|jgi:hypothetical protein|nr:hypothetical protein [Tannerella sp.]
MKINKNVFILVLAAGLWLAGCSQAEDLPPVPEPETEEPEVENPFECKDPLCHAKRGGTDLWSSLHSDPALRDKLVGKWRQIAWSADNEEEMHYEESDKVLDFTVNGDGLQTSQTVWYHIDSTYLYSGYSIGGEPVENLSIFIYTYLFSEGGNEFTIWYVTGLVPALPYYPVNFVYRRIEE